MPFYTDKTSQFFTKQEPGREWESAYGIGDKVPVSGIYRCTGCGDEITSNKGDIFPPQNKTQHPYCSAIQWRLVAKTRTQA